MMRNTCGVTSSGQRFLLAHVLLTCGRENDFVRSVVTQHGDDSIDRAGMLTQINIGLDNSCRNLRGHVCRTIMKTLPMGQI